MMLLGEYRTRYAVLVVCGAVKSGAGGMLHPLLVRGIFDTVSAGADFGRLVYLVLGYLAMGLSLNGFGYLIGLWERKLDNQIVARASTELLGAYFRHDYGTILREGTGYYVARIRSDVKEGLEPMLGLVRKLCVSSVLFTCLVGVLVFISWQAFLTLAVIIPVATAISLAVSKKIRGLTALERDQEARLLDILTKSIGAFKLASTFQMIPKTLDTVSNGMAQVLDAGFRKFRVLRRLQGASDVTMVISDTCSIFVGAMFVFRKQMSIGSFIAFMNAFWRSATTLIAIFQQWAELQSHSTTVNRLADFLRQRTDAPSGATGRAVRAGAIAYGYGAELILSNFSLYMEPGTSALIIGQNGSGKTTLANILAGYLVPSAGQLELPARISAVTLPLLFPPIKVGDLLIDRTLLAIFQIDHRDILEAYPDQLSAGQQQKVALALALSHDADLYVLDEPLANLDLSSRALAMVEIRRRTHGRSLVMIMHGAGEYAAMFDQVCLLGADDAGTPVRAAAMHH